MKGLSAKTLFATATLSLAALGSTTAHAAGVEILNEGFGSVSALNGWVQVNDSAPPGNGWFQGNAGVFSAQGGAADSYAAANFLGAANGSGTVDSWLITPTLSLYAETLIDFFTRGTGTPGFNDVLEVRFSAGSSADPSSFTTLLYTLGGNGNYPSYWEHDLAGVNFTGTGRFAFRYVGAADSLNYVGLDTVSVITAIPEPSHWMMLALGMGLLPLLGRAARKS